MEWRPVPEYEGYYEVSDEGQVRSVDRHVVTVIGHRRFYPGVMLRPCNDRDGYPTVVLTRSGRPRRTQKVHLLVAAAFLGPRPAGLEILHGNDVKTDNRAVNLRYGTCSENKYDAVRNGCHPIRGRRRANSQ